MEMPLPEGIANINADSPRYSAILAGMRRYGPPQTIIEYRTAVTPPLISFMYYAVFFLFLSLFGRDIRVLLVLAILLVFGIVMSCRPTGRWYILFAETLCSGRLNNWSARPCDTTIRKSDVSGIDFFRDGGKGRLSHVAARRSGGVATMLADDHDVARAQWLARQLTQWREKRRVHEVE